MKTFFLSVLCATGLATVTHAQVLSDRAARNVLIGGVAGAIIGDHNHRAGEGALIGAAAGLIWTAATEAPRAHTEEVYTYSSCPPPAHEVVVVERQPSRTVVVRRPSRTVVVHRPVVADRVVVIDRDCDRHVVHRPARKVVVVRDPGCSPRYVEVID